MTIRWDREPSVCASVAAGLEVLSSDSSKDDRFEGVLQPYDFARLIDPAGAQATNFVQKICVCLCVCAICSIDRFKIHRMDIGLCPRGQRAT